MSEQNENKQVPTFWKVNKYDLNDVEGRLLASVYRTTGDKWCWFLTAQNAGGECATMNAAMREVESWLKVEPGIVAQVPASQPKDEEEAKVAAQKLTNDVTRNCFEAGAIGFAFVAVVPSQDGKDCTGAYSRMPAVRWSGEETEDDARKVLMNVDNAFTHLLRDAMDKARGEAMRISIAQHAEQAAKSEPVEQPAEPTAQA